MKNRWSQKDADQLIKESYDENLALRLYSSHLIGSEPKLSVYGSGSFSYKSVITDIFNQQIPALFINVECNEFTNLTTNDFIKLDLTYLQRFSILTELSSEKLALELKLHQLSHGSGIIPIEAICHALLPGKYIDYCHPDVILVLSHLKDGEIRIKEALGSDVICLDNLQPGLELAKASANAVAKDPDCRALIWMRHGMLTWGETAKESYNTMIELVTKAEAYIAPNIMDKGFPRSSITLDSARRSAIQIAPILRGLLAEQLNDTDHNYQRVIIHSETTEELLDMLDCEVGRKLTAAPSVYSQRSGLSQYLCIENPNYADIEILKEQLNQSISEYRISNEGRIPGLILIPGLGIFGVGKNITEARISLDFGKKDLAIKTQTNMLGEYDAKEGKNNLPEIPTHNDVQPAKPNTLLKSKVALVTGAAGAIGWGICKTLLEQDCHVAATDISEGQLDGLVSDLRGISSTPKENIIGVKMDVTNQDSISKSFEKIIQTWGGVDIVILNAGIALVASLAELDIEAFQKLERVNVEGTLLVLAKAARHFKLQETGGDIILVSTKNVFAPGAKFGAYSATKAAAHQLARIASLELAEIDVRVNMVSPDAVFSGGTLKSGLWQEVGPDRMKARGLDEKGLEEYYRSRNLLKTQITAEHVGKAVLYFASRQTPTTGATIPVDGGLPDATPR